MKRFFLFLLCVLALSGRAFPASNEVIDLFIGAFQNSGCNPRLFQTGIAEFEVFRTSEGDKSMEKAREGVRARQEQEIRSTYASEPLEMNKQLKILQNQTAAAAKGTAKQRELLSILFSGTDNTFSKDSPEKCKRRIHSRQFLPTPDNSGQVKPFERQFIFTGVLNQKNSMLNVELIPKSQKVNIVPAFHSQYEFQNFGRIWDVGRSQIASTFRKKMDRKKSLQLTFPKV